MSVHDSPALFEILSEPSKEAFERYSADYGVEYGKFIRIGRLILIAPTIDLINTREAPRHLNMMWAGVENPDKKLASRVLDAIDNADRSKGLSQRDELIDAGHYSTRFSSDSKLTTVKVEKESFDFGRADEAGRQETGKIMGVYLADPSIRVIAE